MIMFVWSIVWQVTFHHCLVLFSNIKAKNQAVYLLNVY